MLVPLTIFCLFFTASSAFNTAQFISKYCVQRTSTYLYCSRFHWTAAEQKDIQSQRFVISQATRVEFEAASIGVLNENLINKFPNAVDFTAYDCEVYLNSSRTTVSQTNTKLETLRIQHSRIFKNKDSSAFNLLTGLRTFELLYPALRDFDGIDDALLSKNVNLVTLTIIGSFRNISAKAFENLRKLQNLTISYTLIKKLPNTLLQTIKTLVSFNLNYNPIEFLPAGSFFPSSLQFLYLNHNKINFVNDNRFNNLPNLKLLDLSNNGLTVFSEKALARLSGLRTLRLDNNNLRNITRMHFANNKLLEEVHLSGFMSLPNDIFDGLNNLEYAKLNAGPMTYEGK